MPARNEKAQFGLLKIILNNSAIWLVKTKPQICKCIAKFHPEERAAHEVYTMKMSSRYHRLLIYDVKRNSEIDDMGPFQSQYHC